MSNMGCHENRNIPKYSVIPPGLDIEKFYPFYHDLLPESTKNEEEVSCAGRLF